MAVSSLDDIRARPERTAFKLDWNEATVPPSPAVTSALQAYLSGCNQLNLYPELKSASLCTKLAQLHTLSEDHFLVTNGSDDALNTICATYLDPRDEVLIVAPTYQHFEVFVQTRGARLRYFLPTDPFETEIDGLLAAAARIRPRMIYLANPNNPTGILYTVDEIESLLLAHPKSLVIVDEAYSEFAGVTARDLLHTYSNLIVTRTFSKAYGMAGLRIGYAMAHPQIIQDMGRIFNPKNVNIMAQIGAAAALDDQDWLDWYLDEVRQSKQLITEWFDLRGLECRMTEGNFFMLRLERAPWMVRALGEQGVYVRDRSHMPGLAGYVRVSIGTVEQTREILRRIGLVLDEAF